MLYKPTTELHVVEVYLRIENSLQYVRDVTKGSDRSQLRSGNAPQIMAALCNLVIPLIHRHWSDQIAITRRQFAYHPCQALKLLLHKRRSCSILGFWLRQDSSAFRLLDD
jgi:hypothetical protein